MKFLEMDLEDIVYHSDPIMLMDRGLRANLRGIKKRQLRIGNYGIADLVIADKDTLFHPQHPFLNVTVFELKKDLVNSETFFQALGYCKGISRYLESRGIKNHALNIVLIGRKICLNNSFCYLTDFIGGYEYGTIQNLSVFTYDYKIDGIQFNQKKGYSMIKEGF